MSADEAFCFYYDDDLDLLREAGAEIAFFSPLRDTSLPPGAGSVYLGGGYPEIYAAQLAANQSLLSVDRPWDLIAAPCITGQALSLTPANGAARPGL